MKKGNNRDYYIIFSGAKLNKIQAKRVGLGVLFGIIGILFTLLMQGAENDSFKKVTILGFTLIGYSVGILFLKD